MQGYAGPVQQGDMVVRANEVSPGITSLLAKQNRKGAQGIYELPSAKQPAPNYYNMALDNVQNEIRTAAQTVNAMAPEGERLAYINPQEEGILKLLGGSGEPEPVTGIPSYYITQKEKESGKTAQRSMKSFARSRDNDNKNSGPIKDSKGNFIVTPDMLTSPGSLVMSPETGGRQAYYATDAASAEAVAKAREAAQRASAGKSYKTYEGALGASDKDANLQTMADLAVEGAEKEKGFFEKLFGNTVIGKGLNLIMKPINDYNFNWYMKNVDPDMGKKFQQLSEKEQQKLKDNPYLIPGYQDYWDQRREDMMAEQMKRDRGGDKPKPVVAEAVEEEEVAEEEELPYFSYARKFLQPMTYEEILKRAYGGTSGPTLESFQDAIKRSRETT